MAKRCASKAYYAVAKGKKKGVFESWEECKEQVLGVKHAKFKKFMELSDAKEFVKTGSSQMRVHKTLTSPLFDKYEVIYTDGACPHNGTSKGEVGGIGVFFGEGDERNVSETFFENPTNQKAELLAIHRALKVSCAVNVQIVTDSKYAIGCCTKWLPNILAGTKKYAHAELIQDIARLMEGRDVQFQHVMGHGNNIGNIRADFLATEACKEL